MTSQSSQIVVPPPPRLTGNYAADQVTIADWMLALYNAIAPSIGNDQLINTALGNASVSGFPLTLPSGQQTG